MRMINCKNGGHLYDADVYRECPYCKEIREREKSYYSEVNVVIDSPWMYQDRGFHSQGKDPETERSPRGPVIMNEAEDVTVSFYQKRSVTGWIVGLTGPVKGQDYRIIPEKNRVGSAGNMDIRLPENSGVERSGHCEIVYEPRGNSFYIQRGSGAVFINDQYLTEDQELKIGDIIQIGNCTYEFIPFCREGRKWDD